MSKLVSLMSTNCAFILLLTFVAIVNGQSTPSSRLDIMTNDTCYQSLSSDCGSCMAISGCMWCNHNSYDGSPACLEGGLLGAIKPNICNHRDGWYYGGCSVNGQLMSTNWTYVIFIIIGCFLFILLIGLSIIICVSCMRRKKKRENAKKMKKARTEAKLAELRAKDDRSKNSQVNVVVSNPPKDPSTTTSSKSSSSSSEPPPAAGAPRATLLEKAAAEREMERKAQEDRLKAYDEARVKAGSMRKKNQPVQRQAMDDLIDELENDNQEDSESQNSTSYSESSVSSSPSGNEVTNLKDMGKKLSSQDIDRIIGQMNESEEAPQASEPSGSVSEGWEEVSSESNQSLESESESDSSDSLKDLLHKISK